MRVLVTGGTGYLGQALVRALVAHGHEPVIFARRATEARLPGTAVDGDVRDATALCRAADGCDALLHSAALVSIWQPQPEVFDEVNVGGLRHAIRATRQAGLHRLVYTSSFLGRPPAGATRPLAANDYQRTKALALDEARKARDEGAPIVVMIPGVVYGPGIRSEGNLVGRLVADHLSGRLPGIVGGDRLWSFAFVDEVARAHVAALERDDVAPEYEVGGENLPQRTIFEWLRARTGRRLPRELPAGLARFAGWCEEWRVRVAGGLPLVTRGAVEIFRHDWPLDSSAAIGDLGYHVVPLAEGLTRTLEAIAPVLAPSASQP